MFLHHKNIVIGNCDSPSLNPETSQTVAFFYRSSHPCLQNLQSMNFEVWFQIMKQKENEN